MPEKKFENIVVGGVDEGVVVIQLHRPAQRNAISTPLLAELSGCIATLAEDNAVCCVVISGSEKCFAAGADIKEMAALDAVGVLNSKRAVYWDVFRRFPKPWIAAVNGYALGGGCELAMHADIIIAGHNAKFGQPEINLGIIPGAGGTQRLIRCVGKALAMKMVLSGEFIDAEQALAAGLVAEVTEPELSLSKAVKLAKIIASKAPLAVRQAKELMLTAFESSLESALAAERKAFILLAATKDRQEGMTAFLEKRPPSFSGE